VGCAIDAVDQHLEAAKIQRIGDVARRIVKNDRGVVSWDAYTRSGVREDQGGWLIYR
jgi:hypothetical protein